MARAVLSLEGDPAQMRSVFAGLRQDARAMADGVAGDFRRIGNEAERSTERMRKAWERARQTAVDSERAATAAVVDGVQQRKAKIDEEAGYRTNALKTPREEARRTEDAITTVVERASRRRIATIEREAQARRRAFQQAGAEAAGRGFDAVSSATGQLVSEAGGVRRTVAQREQAINNALVQLAPQGATATEIARNNDFIQREIRRRNLDPDTAASALGDAQSFANALGGATPAARRAAISSTLDDVSLAANIDPTNMGGLVKFGAMLRSRGVAEPIRQQMLRSAVGISFAGSVETEQALRGGLGGLLRTVSTMTANAPASQRDQITRDVTADFLAQLQTVAASGGTVVTTSNRINTLRNALSNTRTQDRLGQALAGRAMNDEQRALFGEAFQRGSDGRYALNQSFVNSPSEAARLFGGLFNNDATAVATFLGTHGGGGPTQLLNRPEAGLLTSYFGSTQDSRGRSVRQYELVNELRRTTLTPDQEAEIARVRQNELANEERRRAAERERNLGTQSIFGRVSNAVDEFSAAHPFVSALTLGAVPALGRMAVRAGGGRIGGAIAGALTTGGRLAMRANPLLLAASLLGETRNERQGYFDDAAAIAAHRTGGVAAGARAGATGQPIDGRNGDGSVPVRLDPASAQVLGQAIASGLRTAGGVPVQLPPNDDAAARARAASGSTPPAP